MSTLNAELHERWPATPQSIGLLRRGVIGLAIRGGATDAKRQDIALAVSEALTNVVAHAYPDDRIGGTVAVQAALEDHALEVVVVDEGVGMPSPTSLPPARLGLAVIARAADQLAISDARPGARVRMRFTIG
jgi:anti-sigma regulatory factor (Ser/Thr protein kinase)